MNDEVQIRFAEPGDAPWVETNDRHLRHDLIMAKIAANEVLLASSNNQLVGLQIGRAHV